MKAYRFLLRLNGIFYFLTGVWPVLHISSFMAVTGPKTDIWLVKTVGLLITACSIGMLAASFRQKFQPDVILILLGFEVFLTGVDIYYVANRVISPVYLADAVVETVLILLWLYWWFRNKTVLHSSEKLHQ